MIELLRSNPIACAVCFGDPNSLSSKALGWAVILLILVVGSVLFGIGWTAFQWSKRENAQ
jgi:uncharacterized membrane protein YedE/YeeE